MVLAYALLHTPPFWPESLRALEKSDEIAAPEFLRAELLNVVWLWMAAKRINLEAGQQILSQANGLLTRVVSTESLWNTALTLAQEKHHSPYDMLFVALAADRGSRVVTYDRRLQALCPEYTISVAEYLRGLMD